MQQETLSGRSLEADSLQQLTYNVAHDLNNVLTLIIVNTQLAMKDMPESPRNALEEILKAGCRGRDLVKQIFDSRKKTGKILRLKRGVLEIRLRKVQVRKGAEQRDLGLPPGSYLNLEVKDSGHGMVPEVMDKIFEPFFPTKGPECGPGLALPVVEEIIKSHHGAIRCRSLPGEGTSMEVYLPEYASGSCRKT